MIGRFKYEKAVGSGTPDSQMELNSTFVLAYARSWWRLSMIYDAWRKDKLGLMMTSNPILTEFEDIQILTGFETDIDGNDVPILKPAKNKITLSLNAKHWIFEQFKLCSLKFQLTSQTKPGSYSPIHPDSDMTAGHQN